MFKTTNNHQLLGQPAPEINLDGHYMHEGLNGSQYPIRKCHSHFQPPCCAPPFGVLGRQSDMNFHSKGGNQIGNQYCPNKLIPFCPQPQYQNSFCQNQLPNMVNQNIDILR